MENKIKQIKTILPTFIQSWHKIPKDIDVSNINVIEIRRVDGFSREDDLAWIIVFNTTQNTYRELLLDEELEYTVEEFKAMFERENKNYRLLARDVVCKQFYYEHPLVYGEDTTI
ncbi:hypothetical protein [Bacillus bombysepticus]|uniref:hypothetical protein n=1 Tax=Bacillus bombysepticus TaxID=658666 RepID=UPI00301967A6